LKFDFVEDFYELIEPLKSVNGMNVLSIADIYLRKIFVACGSIPKNDSTGKKMYIGDRQEVQGFL
jgi:hypothetical protein